MPPKKGWFGQLNEHFHTHPKGRLHEFLFWFGLGTAFLLFAWFGWRFAWISTPIALMFAVIALSLMGWSLLPQHHPRAAPTKISPKSKRNR